MGSGYFLNKKLIREIVDGKHPNKRIRWPLCENCGHDRICHGDRRRCFYKKKRKHLRCDCMSYRGEIQLIEIRRRNDNPT